MESPNFSFWFLNWLLGFVAWSLHFSFYALDIRLRTLGSEMWDLESGICFVGSATRKANSETQNQI